MANISTYDRSIILSNDPDLNVNRSPSSASERQVLLADGELYIFTINPTDDLIDDFIKRTTVSRGLYTPDQVIQKRNDAMTYFLEQFGIDFINDNHKI